MWHINILFIIIRENLGEIVKNVFNRSYLPIHCQFFV